MTLVYRFVSLLLLPLLLLSGLQTRGDAFASAERGNALNRQQTACCAALRDSVAPSEIRGLYYLRARYLNAANGRFWNADSYEGRRKDPGSLHKYLYVDADPVGGCDPSGHEFSIVGQLTKAYVSAQVAVATIPALAATLRVAQFGLVASTIGFAVTDPNFAGMYLSTGGNPAAEISYLFGELSAARQIVAARAFPLGFKSFGEFKDFLIVMRQGLVRAGARDAGVAFQGSSVTGTSYDPSKGPFDSGRLSDFDVAIGSEDLLASAKALGVELRGAGSRTRPLSLEKTPDELKALGLFDTLDSLGKIFKRPVNIMIYDDIETAIIRSPSLPE